MVVVLQQWLVRHLTKRMMQLMTSEAFTEHRSKIPSSYLENYLAFQTHFSLNNLIRKYLSGLANKWSARCTRIYNTYMYMYRYTFMYVYVHCLSFLHFFDREPTFPTSKILCFTRSSPLIHQLPAQYPSQAFDRQSKDDINQTLKVQGTILFIHVHIYTCTMITDCPGCCHTLL